VWEVRQPNRQGPERQRVETPPSLTLGALNRTPPQPTRRSSDTRPVYTHSTT
jgi:hypothetical protein